MKGRRCVEGEIGCMMIVGQDLIRFSEGVRSGACLTLVIYPCACGEWLMECSMINGQASIRSTNSVNLNLFHVVRYSNRACIALSERGLSCKSTKHASVARLGT